MSIFGTPVFDSVGGFNGGSYASDSLNVAANALIVVCVIGATSAFPVVSVADTASNSYTSLTAQVSGSNSYQWWYCLAAAADAATVITATYTGSGSFGALNTWVIPISGGTPSFDVEATIKNLSGTGDQNTNTFNTAGADEIGFCTLFDTNGVAGSSAWTPVSPATLNSGNCAVTRSAADYITWASTQTATSIGLSNTGAGNGGIMGIAFQASGGSGGAIACNMAGLGAISASTGAFNLAAVMAGHGTVAGALFGKGALAAAVAGHGAIAADGLGLSLLTAALDGTSALTGTLGGKGTLAAALTGHGILFGTLSTPYALNSNMLGRGSVVAFPTIPPAKEYFYPNNPMGRQSPPYIIRDFGASAQRPAYVSTSGNALQLFYQPSFIPNVNAGDVLPPTWSTPATPDNQGYQGRVQSPGRIMVAPDNLRLSGKIYKVVAQGMIFVPSSAVNPTFSLQMFQNYFTFGKPAIADSLFSGAPIPLTPGTMTGFSLVSTLAGNGVGSGVLSSAGILWVGGQQYFGNGFSNRLQGQEPIIQLSLGLTFSGTISDGELFQAFLSKFQIFNAQF